MEIRPAQSLQILHDYAFAIVKDNKPDLSFRQLTILLTIYLEPPPHTVKGLAQKLNVTKPVITRALDSLGQKKLLTRRRDPQDKRNVLISRTVDGALLTEHFADLLTKTISSQKSL